MTGDCQHAAGFLGGRFALIIVRVLAIGIALVLATSAFQKSLDPRNTIAALEWAGIPGEAGVRALVAWEMILAVGLGVWVLPLATSVTASLTFFVFSAWIAVLIVADAPVGCGCTGGAAFEQAIAERPKALFKSSSLAATSLLCVCVAFHVRPHYTASNALT